MAALNGSGSLLLGVAPSVLDLDESGMGCNLPVKERLNLAVVAVGIEALVALNVAKEGRVVSAAAGASGASSGGGVEGGVFAVERRVRERQIKVGLYPCGKAAARQAEFERQRAEYEEERQRREEERKQQFEQEQAEIEAERNRKAEILKTREATFERILENAPAIFTAAQLRVFLSALCNLDPYTLTEDIAEHFAEKSNDHQQTPEEILASALAETPDEKLTSFALRLALTGYIAIPRENELDYLAEAEAAFAPPPPAKRKPKATKLTLVKATTKASPKAAPKKASTFKKKVAA